MARKNPFAEFSLPMLEKFHAAAMDIRDKYLINPQGESFVITRMGDDPLRNTRTRDEVLRFFKKMGVIESFEEDPWKASDLHVTVSKNLFKECLAELEKAMEGSESSPKKGSRNQSTLEAGDRDSSRVLYRVTLTAADEIFINGFFLSKAQTDKENADVFRYLYEHPNQPISKDELSREIAKKKDRGQKAVFSVGKDLRKIVENLRFTDSLQKMFFRIVTDKKKKIETILFRNPVTKDDCLQLDLPYLSISRKTK